MDEFRNITATKTTICNTTCRNCNDRTFALLKENTLYKQLLLLYQQKISTGCSHNGGCDDQRAGITLELDHIIASTKIHTVGKSSLYWWVGKFKAAEVSMKYQLELDKCQVLCVHHHRVKTWAARRTTHARTLRNQGIVRDFKWQKGKCDGGCGLLVTSANVEFGFDFNHMDPNTKTENISNLVACRYSVDKLHNELKKCNLLCANLCHPNETMRQSLQRRALLSDGVSSVIAGHAGDLQVKQAE